MNKYINTMKQSLTERWALLLVTFFAISMTALADTNLWIPNFSITANETKTVEVWLENDEPATQFQFDMLLPEGYTFVEGSAVKTSRLTGRGVIIEATEVEVEGTDMIRFCKAGGNTIAAGEGAVITFKITADEYVEGTSWINLYNIVISNADAEQIGNSTSKTKITVPDVENCFFGTTVESFELGAGDEYQVDITLTNESVNNLSAFSGTLTLPEGLKLVPGEDGDFIYTDRLPEPLEFQFNWNEEKTVANFLLSSSSNTLIEENEGVLFSFIVKAEKTFKGGDITLTNLMLANNKGGSTEEGQLDDIIINVTSAYIPGDVNGDGLVDLSDAIMVTYYALNEPPSNFNEAAADVNGDGQIDLSDAITIIYMSLGVKE